jgi:hypothetical protein
MKAEKQPLDRLPRHLFQTTSTRNVISFTSMSKQVYSLNSGHSAGRKIQETDTWNRIFPKVVLKLGQSSSLYTYNKITENINVAKGRLEIFQ